MLAAFIAAAVLIATPSPQSEAERNLKAFPPADEGMSRHVLMLPPQCDDAAFQVQILAGRTESLDEHNRYFFTGGMKEVSIEGWGFTAYRLDALGPMAGTRMAVDPDAPKVDRFVTLGGEPMLVRYNSRLPLVIYVPNGVEVRYRIWIAGPEMRAIAPG